eukprot:COSAG02_NODE_4149_length_5710_cov_6.668330_3_plen_63_part_00
MALILCIIVQKIMVTLLSRNLLAVDQSQNHRSRYLFLNSCRIQPTSLSYFMKLPIVMEVPVN